MSPTFEAFSQSMHWLGPALVLILSGCLIFCGSLVTPTALPRDASNFRNGYAAITLLLLGGAFAWHLFRQPPPSNNVMFGLFVWDSTSIAAERLALLGGVILALICWSMAPRTFLPEYFGCLTIIIGALCLVGSCNDLIALFLALELISIPTYVLLGTARGEDGAQEASIKYFLLSAFASAFFLLGGSYLYGVAGTTDLTQVAIALNSTDRNMLGLLGLIFVVCGLAFRITAVPFHFYGPDVFEGTSISMAAMMSYVPKVAGFVAFARLLSPLSPESFVAIKLVPLLLILSVLTFCVGNAMAVIQVNLRRLLGYSSVAHSGYLLLGLATVLIGGPTSDVIFLYLAVYAAMTLGVFAFLAEVEAAGGKSQMVSDLSGMFYRRPAASVAAVICLISLIGLPPTAGLWAKFQIIYAAVHADRWDFLICVILLAFNAAIAVGYYWRILAKLFDRSAPMTPMPLWRPSLFLAYSICAALSLIWFFVPNGI